MIQAITLKIKSDEGIRLDDDQIRYGVHTGGNIGLTIWFGGYGAELLDCQIEICDTEREATQ